MEAVCEAQVRKAVVITQQYRVPIEIRGNLTFRELLDNVFKILSSAGEQSELLNYCFAYLNGWKIPEELLDSSISGHIDNSFDEQVVSIVPCKIFWYRVEMVADDQTAIVVDVPDADRNAVESFMKKCTREAENIMSWIGGCWSLRGPFMTEDEAWAGWVR